MIGTTKYPVHGTVNASKGTGPAFQGVRSGANPLERLVRIMQENQQLLEQLKRQGEALSRARAHVEDPSAKGQFAELLLNHSKEKYARLVHLIRANRAEALGILRASGQIGCKQSRIS